MKKAIIIIVLLSAAFAGCKKSTGPYTTSIQYKYTSNVSSRYGVSYSNVDGALADTAFSGITFTLTVNTNQASFASSNVNNNQAVFTVINTTSPATPVTGTMSILVNNNVTDTLSVSFQQYGPSYFTTTSNVY